MSVVEKLTPRAVKTPPICPGRRRVLIGFVKFSARWETTRMLATSMPTPTG
jgi:hypothetical protein